MRIDTQHFRQLLVGWLNQHVPVFKNQGGHTAIPVIYSDDKGFSLVVAIDIHPIEGNAVFFEKFSGPVAIAAPDCPINSDFHRRQSPDPKIRQVNILDSYG
jgi:hypothetical protein